MAKKQNATIKEVAELANVSQMTVSRVLNDQEAVKPSTRESVQAAMRELHYRPNIMARNLAGRTGLFIGLIYRNPSYGYLSEFLLGALNACREQGHYLIVEEPLVDDDMVDLQQIEKRFLDTSIQALIVVPPLSDDPTLIETLESTGIPFVCISPNSELYTGPSVRMRDRDAALDMTEYLLSMGHKEIAIITGPKNHMASELRLLGFEDAIKAHGLQIDDDLTLCGDFTYVSGMQAAIQLLARNTPPTAIFACNDDMAAGAIAAAHQAGLQVPGDVSVVGFDDTANASAMWPPLTTIRQPIREMAANAIKILSRIVSETQNPDAPEPQAQTLNYELIVRKSAGPPKQSD
jgi:LacI family transcriptional regulator